MPISSHDLAMMQMRGVKIDAMAPTRTAVSLLDERESNLHKKIIDHCNAQHPRWKFYHCRTDRKSTVEVGAADFVIFLPNGKTIVMEIKNKTGKLSTEQQGWIKEMSMLDHTVFVCRSMDDFLNIVPLAHNHKTKQEDERE